MRKYTLAILLSLHFFAFQAHANQFASFGFNEHGLSTTEQCILGLVREKLGMSTQKTFEGLFGLSGDEKVAILNSYIGDDKEVTSCVLQFHSKDGWVWKNKNFHMVLETNTLDPNIEFSFGSTTGLTLNIGSCL